MSNSFSKQHNLLALFGGTFDPIHFGHLRPVQALAQQVGLEKVILLPNHVPPHRPQPEATPSQRLEMVRLAIQDNPLFAIDTRELAKNSPSYTIETLAELRQEIGPEKPLAFIIGQDSLLSINKWYGWDRILDNCHLLVCSRPGYATQFSDPIMQNWLLEHQTTDPIALNQTANGYIFIGDTPLVNISATEIREKLSSGDSCHELIPDAVLQYIHQQHLYQQ
ncbi:MULTISPECIES: nicotinate-nucleotide adenylyltransferase [Providencia]|uniref:Probable nicotinate-nucleotide adenylyltransferase n=1 Tax=Providencia rettgeri TaxID=587 RepID=A0A379FV21_PRORE|nr:MULTISPECIES: nicotinate-nucleotide adenylyltransferase [Providencia]EJD6376943.1 nicotinate-nucleotide adenylyltransferase [Providencia rettgeri]ELR5118238.1 nicotinate-nucleotide adenylyltransferase [Providencia rettgeri]MBI6202760.1 nicotinate-nucleotide adenylyltransferase [Providencia rettgeri]MCG5281025.1 nicotinate-nucleotide adenylyltransferase [Providencia rettgeri]MDH2366980.1 nicotinate-nucleotide adenylyltransferase [Providencia rettgeri]